MAEGKATVAYPDTVVGTDSHTTMINGLAVLGWGVGGIEAEAAMLGQPIPMLIPEVVGFRLTGALPEGATATDLVLTVTEMLRKRGVVDKFVDEYAHGRTPNPCLECNRHVKFRHLVQRARQLGADAAEPAGDEHGATSAQLTSRCRWSGATGQPPKHSLVATIAANGDLAVAARRA